MLKSNYDIIMKLICSNKTGWIKTTISSVKINDL